MARLSRLFAIVSFLAMFVLLVSKVSTAQSGTQNQNPVMTVNGLAVITNGASWSTGALGGTTTGPRLALGFDSGNSIAYIGAAKDATTFADFRFRGNRISFWTGTDTLSEKATLNSDGNLGVGTATPLEKLHINLGNLRIDGTQGIHGIIFPDGTKQTTAAVSGVAITSPDNSIIVGGSTVSPTVQVNFDLLDAHYASAATVAALNAQISSLNSQVSSLNSEVIDLTSQVSNLQSSLTPPFFGAIRYRYGQGTAVATDKNGNYVIAGSSTNSYGTILDFGCGSITNSGGFYGFVVKFNASGTCLWSKIFGGGASGNQSYPTGVAIDPSGNVVATGYYVGAVNFGGGQLNSYGSQTNVFIAKFGSDGSYRWAKSVGGAMESVSNGVAVDTSGNVSITGYMKGSMDFGGGAITTIGSYDAFVAKYSADGTYQWAKNFGFSGYGNNGLTIATYSTGDIVVAPLLGGPGYIGSTFMRGGSALVKLASSDGSVVWAKDCGGIGIRAIAMDSGNNIIATGSMLQTATLGSIQLTSAGLTDIVLAKFSSNDGSAIWAERFGGTIDDVGYGVAVDPSGYIFVTGYFRNTANFGGGNISSHGYTGSSYGQADIFVAKYCSDGSYLWAKDYGEASAASGEYGKAMAVLSNGNVIVTGNLFGTVVFENGTLGSNPTGALDVFTLQLRSN